MALLEPEWTRRELLRRAAATIADSRLRTWRAFVSPKPDLAGDPRRPQYHLLPAANWMNDPNGPIYWKGQYHMFFQYNPNGAYWGDMHWAHAVSPDMVHWRHLPVALSPTPGGPDHDGCFSGSAVVNHGVPTFIYTGVASVPKEQATLSDGQHNFRETQCIATCDQPLLTTWMKDPTPVIAAPPPGLEITGFRDPCPWRLGNWWYLNVGSGLRGKGGMILLYRSRDFRHWEYLHPLIEGTMPPGQAPNAANPVDSGEMWECPDFFPIRDKYVLIYSTQDKVFWQSGTLDTHSMRFHAVRTGVLDHGSFYAPKTQLDKAGNRVLWGWIPETRPPEEYRAAGWAGMMSLPRVLDLDSKGRLTTRVLPTIDGLRASEQSGTGTVIRDCCGEAQLVAPLSDPLTFSLELQQGGKASAKELISLEWQPQAQTLLLNGSQIPALDPGQNSIEVTACIDGSVIEMFVNGTFAWTKRFYYSGTRAPDIRVSASGTAQLRIWQMKPISPDRLSGQSS
ncbi:MAG: glycoside hydrolase family 32 protein [Acidobacteriaceae bacterium]|nr:glycoside hydrolase family 32 protein [Acidobacteriaceae bacterium]